VGKTTKTGDFRPISRYTLETTETGISGGSKEVRGARHPLVDY